MAEICVEATPSDGLTEYVLALDKEEATLDMIDGRGCGVVTGACGDGSVHELYYQLFGPPGAKLAVKLFCDGNERNTYQLIIYPPGGNIGGYVSFPL
jgi:hypothetical protein